MLVLWQIPEGYALFEVADGAKLSLVEMVKQKAFSEFKNASEAIRSKHSKTLRKVLHAHCKGKTLAVADQELGIAIQEKLNIECTHNDAVMKLMKGMRSQMSKLIPGLPVQVLAPTRMCLPGYKLQNLSPYKDDTIIIEAIGFLDDHDKNLNAYVTRLREWYGWHFPELTKIVPDHIQYAKIVKLMGSRVNAADCDLSQILSEEKEAEVKETAAVSKGTEIGDLDLVNIGALCNQVLALAEFRPQLYQYLKSRMNTIAPNLTALVGELVGAHLIAHAGSLLNLAHQSMGKMHNLGAEETEQVAQKQGYIFYTSLVNQAAPKYKKKVSRSLSAKCALAAKCDAFSDTDGSFGREWRAELEGYMESLEFYNKDGEEDTNPTTTKLPSKKRKRGDSGPMTVQEATVDLDQGGFNEDMKKTKNNVTKLETIHEDVDQGGIKKDTKKTKNNMTTLETIDENVDQGGIIEYTEKMTSSVTKLEIIDEDDNDMLVAEEEHTEKTTNNVTEFETIDEDDNGMFVAEEEQEKMKVVEAESMLVAEDEQEKASTVETEITETENLAEVDASGKEKRKKRKHAQVGGPRYNVKDKDDNNNKRKVKG